ncbi:hypothetical protein [Mycetocola saprophilus]|uniref:hypothetical protein n=1 Tax=Mycetocola saprophilus TaxID=76636 RepID=UPI0012DDC5F5|nr:hypothetical protein [Mycetocola saprophilus]
MSYPAPPPPEQPAAHLLSQPDGYAPGVATVSAPPPAVPPSSHSRGRRSLILILVGALVALVLAIAGGVLGGRVVGENSARSAESTRVEKVLAAFDGKRDYELYDVKTDDDSDGEGVLRRVLRSAGISVDLIDYYYESGADVSISLNLDSGQLSESDCRALAGSLLYVLNAADQNVGIVRLESSDFDTRCSSRTPINPASTR